MRFTLLTLYFFLTAAVFAQSNLYPVYHYTTKDGLSNNVVGRIRQDSRGFLWIATKEGLNRFDGYQFKNYFSEKNNPASVTHNNIRDILEYKPNQLLLATANGLSVLNTLTGKFENEKIAARQLKPALGNTIHSLYKDDSGHIWVNHHGEFDILDNNLKYLYRFSDLDWASNCKGALIDFEDWQTDKQNRLWYLSDTSGITIIDIRKKKVYNASYNPEQLPYLRHDYMRSFLVDEENNAVWYAPWGRGLVRYDVLKKTEQQILFGVAVREESRTINAIVKTKEGNILCFVNGKCFEVNSLTGLYKEIVLQLPDDQTWIGTTTIMKTNDHQYWVGGSGLGLLTPKKEMYKEIGLSASDLSGTGECTDLFLSSSGKLYSTYKNNLLAVVEKDQVNYSFYRLGSRPQNIFNEVSEDGSNQVWAGSTRGLYLLDEKNKTFTQPSFLPAELRTNNINVLYRDKEGDLWIGSRAPFSFYHYTFHNKQFEKIGDNIIAPFVAFGTNSRISEMATDKSGNTWMSSKLGGGILCYENQTKAWKHYPPQGKNLEFLQKKGLTGLCADDSGYLWFSNYYGDGLIRYDPKRDSVDKFTRSDGLSSDYILHITNGNNGEIWLTTEDGVTSFNTRTLRSGSTIAIKGIPQDDQSVVLDQANQTLAIALPNRIVFVPTRAGRENNIPPVPLIDKVMINNQQLFFDPQKEKPVLQYDQKNITIDFTAINLLKEKIRFAYRLSGVDNDWKYTDMTGTAQYSILPPGNYTFIVKSGNDKGDWSPEYELFSFSIQPPWWKTFWFRLLVVAAIAAVIYFLLKRRIQQIKKEADLKHKIAETEMMALRAQMNPHFIFNCINSIDGLIQNNDKYQATVYLNKFAKLIRNILDSSKQNTVTLTKDLETLQLYIELEQLRHENKFIAEINADHELLQDDYKVPPLIIQPFVENAILHGIRHRPDNKGRLLVTITRQGDYLKYIIEDNGVGRHANTQAQKENFSYGIEMSNDRVKLFNNEEKPSVKITDLLSDNKPAGTKVELLLKMQ